MTDRNSDFPTCRIKYDATSLWKFPSILQDCVTICPGEEMHFTEQSC